MCSIIEEDSAGAGPWAERAEAAAHLLALRDDVQLPAAERQLRVCRVEPARGAVGQAVQAGARAAAAAALAPRALPRRALLLLRQNPTPSNAVQQAAGGDAAAPTESFGPWSQTLDERLNPKYPARPSRLAPGALPRRALLLLGVAASGVS